MIDRQVGEGEDESGEVSKSDAWRRSSVRVARAVGSLAQVLGPTQVEDAVAGADRDRIEETGGLFVVGWNESAQAKVSSGGDVNAKWQARRTEHGHEKGCNDRVMMLEDAGKVFCLHRPLAGEGALADVGSGDSEDHARPGDSLKGKVDLLLAV
jgi:hypothetical protein